MSVSRKASQEEIFAAYNWWDKSCLLFQITEERGEYIKACVERVGGRESLRQYEVLEVGCGGGLICANLLQRGSAGAVGIDPSEQALEEARRKTREMGKGQVAYFERGYAEALPYADGSFSAIVCLDVLEHVEDLQKTISEITRVLAPGGVFIFDTVNRTLLARMVLIWIGERFFHSQGLVPGLHEYKRFIKPKELRGVLSGSGLDVREMTGFMPRLSKGRVTLAPGWFMGVSYVGYATKGR